jgi:hypothetical protein
LQKGRKLIQLEEEAYYERNVEVLKIKRKSFEIKNRTGSYEREVFKCGFLMVTIKDVSARTTSLHRAQHNLIQKILLQGHLPSNWF